MNRFKYLDISTRICLEGPIGANEQAADAVYWLRRLAMQATDFEIRVAPSDQHIESRLERGVFSPRQYVELHCREANASRDWIAELMRSIERLAAMACRGAVVESYDTDGIEEAIYVGSGPQHKACAQISHAFDAATDELCELANGDMTTNQAICVGMDPLTNTANVYNKSVSTALLRSMIDGRARRSDQENRLEDLPERPSFMPVLYFDAIDYARLCKRADNA